jgi:hypothetical protein
MRRVNSRESAWRGCFGDRQHAPRAACFGHSGVQGGFAQESLQAGSPAQSEVVLVSVVKAQDG